MVEAHEIAERIHEHHGEHAHARAERDGFRRFTGIYVGVVAMLLAIASLGNGSATKEMLSANIHASDTYSFYQAKYSRQISYQIAAEQLELTAAAAPGLNPDQANRVAALTKRYRDTATRYESEPEKGDGKKELLAKADEWERMRDHAAAQTPNFELAEAFFQIAIVLGSVAIVAASPWIITVSAVLAGLDTLLTVNGFFLIAPLPIG